jgi:hypothetical protein
LSKPAVDCRLLFFVYMCRLLMAVSIAAASILTAAERPSQFFGQPWLKAAAQAPAFPSGDSAWDELSRTSGSRSLIVLRDGIEVRGRLGAVTARDITVDGKRFLREQVREVYGFRRDRSWTGGVAGAAVGFGAGFALLAIAKGRGGDWAWSDGVELFGPIGAAAGFPVGFLIDRARSSRQLLYRAP